MVNEPTVCGILIQLYIDITQQEKGQTCDRHNSRVNIVCQGSKATDYKGYIVSVAVQSLSHVQLFVSSWTVAHESPLFSSIYQSLLRFMSIKSMIPSNHVILYFSLLLLTSVFTISQPFPKSKFFASGGQHIGAPASTSALPVNIQD